MAASVQFRPQNRDLGMVMREVDEDLAIFLGMRNIEKPNNDHFLVEHSSVGPMPNTLLTSNALQVDNVQADPIDNFLKMEIERNDYDWLLTQADTSLLPSVEVGSLQESEPEATQNEILKGEGISLESEMECKQSASVSNNSSTQPASKRRSSSGEQKRAPTPTKRSSLPAKPKPSRAPTPTSRATLPSPKPVPPTQTRSSAPAKTASRPSTPAGRPSTSAISKSGTRSITPTCKPAPPAKPSRGASTGHTKPLEKLSVSHDAIQNPKTLMPKRPASASRGRPNVAATNISKGKPRQKSCSPARVRVPISTASKSVGMIMSRSRGYSEDDVNPVLMGTQMVERVVNSRKLAPPKQEECLSHENPKKSSKASGFGRSLSSKSLDMAVRHMDITRSVADNKRLVAAGALSSSIRARSCTTKRSPVLASESPVASFSDSSESNISINSNSLDGIESEN